MPITGDEFEEGVADVERGDETETPHETEKELIVSFLSEHHDQAFTEREIVLGADFSSYITDGPDFGIGAIANAVENVVGDAAASTIVVDDVDAALAELVEEGTVEERAVETDSGPVTYYRLSDGE